MNLELIFGGRGRRRRLLVRWNTTLANMNFEGRKRRGGEGGKRRRFGSGVDD